MVLDKYLVVLSLSLSIYSSIHIWILPSSHFHPFSLIYCYSFCVSFSKNKKLYRYSYYLVFFTKKWKHSTLCFAFGPHIFVKNLSYQLISFSLSLWFHSTLFYGSSVYSVSHKWLFGLFSTYCYYIAILSIYIILSISYNRLYYLYCIIYYLYCIIYYLYYIIDILLL